MLNCIVAGKFFFLRKGLGEPSRGGTTDQIRLSPPNLLCILPITKKLCTGGTAPLITCTIADDHRFMANDSGGGLLAIFAFVKIACFWSSSI